MVIFFLTSNFSLSSQVNMMAELPSNVFLAEEFLEYFVSGLKLDLPAGFFERILGDDCILGARNPRFMINIEPGYQ